MDRTTNEEVRRERRLRRRGWMIAAIAVVLAWATPALSLTSVPYVFSPNTPARASEINANFAALASAIDALDAANDTRLDAAEARLTALESRGDFVPTGTIAFFATAACPAGWSEYTGANGRYVVAVTGSGTAGGTVGVPMGDLANPTHTHTIAHRHPWLRAVSGDKTYHSYTSSTPGTAEATVRDWDSRIGGDGSRWPFTYEVDGTLYTGDNVQPNSGTARTSDVAPYIQLRACRKS